MSRFQVAIGCAVLVLFTMASAKEPPAQVIVWPASGSPVLRFSFSKFREISQNFARGHRFHISTQDRGRRNCSASQPESSEAYGFDPTRTAFGLNDRQLFDQCESRRWVSAAIAEV
jgi:hypothetical protein